jgi:Fur family ferric uptake transcriptional regulator
MVRNTQQRQAIYQTLMGSGRPLSVSEIFELAGNRVKGLGIATVYRSLKALEHEGRIRQVDLPGQSSRWELPGRHHHHFLCRTCDKLFEIHACPVDIKKLVPSGYRLEEHDILLHGQCDVCADANAVGIQK